jgi:hypothetical protein|nr:MAG TPA: hypothetical protein [Caudoviricetes sp.]
MKNKTIVGIVKPRQVITSTVSTSISAIREVESAELLDIYNQTKNQVKKEYEYDKTNQ